MNTKGRPTTSISISVQEGKLDDQSTYAAVTARSYHPGRVNAGLLDGSVHAINDNIELEQWRRLGTIAGGEVVDGL